MNQQHHHGHSLLSKTMPTNDSAIGTEAGIGLGIGMGIEMARWTANGKRAMGLDWGTVGLKLRKM